MKACNFSAFCTGLDVDEEDERTMFAPEPARLDHGHAIYCGGGREAATGGVRPINDQLRVLMAVLMSSR